MKNLKGLINTLKLVSSEKIKLCPTKLELLISVHENPNLQANTHATLLKLPESSVNRHFRELKVGKVGSSQNYNGLGLVSARKNQDDWRCNEVYLTRKGIQFMRQLQDFTNSEN